MPAHHRFHPYEIQTIALFLSFVPCLAAMVLAFAGRHLDELRRSRKPASVAMRPSAVFVNALLRPSKEVEAA